MDIFNAMEINSSGMSAERKRLNVISSNIANARTTRTENGGPYKRKDVIFQEIMFPKSDDSDGSVATGVGVSEVIEDQKDPQLVYDPDHPDANEEGYVSYPNVVVVEEMVNMINATKSYEANATAIQAAKDMAKKALNISA